MKKEKDHESKKDLSKTKNIKGAVKKQGYESCAMMIWDKGTFKNIKKDNENNTIDFSDAYKIGTIEVNLKEKKISGGYALVQMRSGNMKGNWLLIKMIDTKADTHRKFKMKR